MRALLHTRLGWNSGADQSTIAKIKAVSMPGGYLQRDLWFWITKDAGSYPDTEVIKVYVYQSQEDAEADQNVVAQNVNVTGTGTVAVTFTNGAYPPDMSALAITMEISASDDAVSQIYAYTCQVGVLAVEYLGDLLAEYTGSGQALEGVDSSRIFKHVVDLWNHTEVPAVYISAGATSSPPGVVQARTAHVPIHVRAYTTNLSSPDQAFKDSRILQEKLASIVFEEQRTLYGLVIDMGFVSINPGRAVNAGDSAFYVESELVANALFPVLRYDREA